MTSIQTAVIIPAAGSSQRFIASGGKGPKLQQLIDGRPVLMHAVELFLGRPEVCQVIIAVPADELEDYQDRLGTKLGFHDVTLVAGGDERWHTVQKVMQDVTPIASHIAVHDAARPVTSPALLDRLFAAAGALPAVAPGLAVSDTLKRVGPAAMIETEQDAADVIFGDANTESIAAQPIVETVDRASLVAIQTPQVFEAGLLQDAYAKLGSGLIDAAKITDDAGLVEQLGQTVHVVSGELSNLKITEADDLKLCEAIVQSRKVVDTRDAIKDLFGDDD